MACHLVRGLIGECVFACDVYPLACPAWLLGVSCGRAIFLLHPVWAGKCVIPPWMSNLQAGPTPGLWLPAERLVTQQHRPARAFEKCVRKHNFMDLLGWQVRESE